MECDICDRPFNTHRKPICVSCTQSTLHHPRIQQASALLARERAHNHAEAVVRPGNDGVLASLAEDADWEAISTGVQTHSVERARAEREAVQARIENITSKAAELRAQIEGFKLHFAKQRELHVRREKDLVAERKQLEKQRARLMDPLYASSRKLAQKLDKAHLRTVDARAVLCREASSLSGLQKHRGLDDQSQYWLGGLPVPDLRDFTGKLNHSYNYVHHSHNDSNSSISPAPHEVISAALDNICRLLGACCHYLSIRLPAEIILPHPNHPHSIILPEKASYKLQPPPYPSTTTSSASSPSASRTPLSDRSAPSSSSSSRPRLLVLDRPLAVLAKDDPKGFALLVEGIMLLAWDVAWLCRVQGVQGMDSFDDVCAVGRNLHRLLVAQESHAVPPPLQAPPPSLALAPSLEPLQQNADRATRITSDGGTGVDKNAATGVSASLGVFSHASSAQHALLGATGQDLVRSWRLLAPARLLDKLKTVLLAEMAGAEWDFVEEEEGLEEMDEGTGREERTEVNGAITQMGDGKSGGVVGEEAGDDSGQAKGRGHSGWMKVRGRGVES